MIRTLANRHVFCGMTTALAFLAGIVVSSVVAYGTSYRTAAALRADVRDMQTLLVHVAAAGPSEVRQELAAIVAKLEAINGRISAE